jgi:uncharacterized protein YciI
MPLYVITFMDKPGMLEARVAARDRHLAYLRETGVTKAAGPFLNAEGQMVGSMLIVEADDEAGARAFAAGDPYTAAGLYDEAEVRAWRHGYGTLP